MNRAQAAERYLSAALDEWATVRMSALGGWFDPVCSLKPRRHYEPCFVLNQTTEIAPVEPLPEPNRFCNLTLLEIKQPEALTPANWMQLAEELLKEAVRTLGQANACSDSSDSLCTDNQYLLSTQASCEAELILRTLNVFADGPEACNCHTAPWTRIDVRWKHDVPLAGRSRFYFENGQQVPELGEDQEEEEPIELPLLPPIDFDLADFIGQIQVYEHYASCDPGQVEESQTRYAASSQKTGDEEACEDCPPLLPSLPACRDDSSFQLLLLTMVGNAGDPSDFSSNVQQFPSNYQLLLVLDEQQVASAAKTVPDDQCAGSGMSTLGFGPDVHTNYAELFDLFRDTSTLITYGSVFPSVPFSIERFTGGELGTTVLIPSLSNSPEFFFSVHLPLSDHVNMHWHSKRIELARGSGIPRLVARHYYTSDSGISAALRCYDLDLINNDFQGARIALAAGFPTGVFFDGTQHVCPNEGINDPDFFLSDQPAYIMPECEICLQFGLLTGRACTNQVLQNGTILFECMADNVPDGQCYIEGLYGERFAMRFDLGGTPNHYIDNGDDEWWQEME